MVAIFGVTTLLGSIQFVVGWGVGVHPVIGHLPELYLLDAAVNCPALYCSYYRKRAFGEKSIFNFNSGGHPSNPPSVSSRISGI
jgi:hypothetical protein